MERVHAFVSGRVQGVSFRYYTRLRATRLDLTGWVRNMLDGSVEVVAEGPREVLEQFVEFLHKGSPSAHVEHVSVDWQSATGEFQGFGVRS